MAARLSAISDSATTRANPDIRHLRKAPIVNPRSAMCRPVVAAALCAFLAACAAPPQGTGSDTVATSPRAIDHEAEAPAPEQSPTPVRRAAIDPASLVGMSGGRISALFGDPVFVRRDGPGEFWRYRGRSCVLELFFYADGGTQRVRHIETRASGGKTPNTSDCVAALRRDPAKS